MIHNVIRDFMSFLKQFKKTINGIIIVLGMVVLLTIGWNIVKFHRLQTSLQDVYFTEYGDGVTTIHKYDVAQKETVTVAILDGRYDNCRINRSEGFIIGRLYSYNTKATVWMQYNLVDNTSEEIKGEEVEKIEEKIKEEKKIPERVVEKWGNMIMCWSSDGEKAVFCDNKNKRIYLYDANAETSERILKAGWNHTFGDYMRLDDSGKYLFYKDNFILLFQAANVKIMIYDMQTGMKTTIYERKNTLHEFRFVQEIN